MKRHDVSDTGNKEDVANNRAYYAIFHAVSAVLSLEGVAFKEDTVQQIKTADKLVQLASDFCRSMQENIE